MQPRAITWLVALAGCWGGSPPEDHPPGFADAAASSSDATGDGSPTACAARTQPYLDCAVCPASTVQITATDSNYYFNGTRGTTWQITQGEIVRFQLSADHDASGPPVIDVPDGGDMCFHLPRGDYFFRCTHHDYDATLTVL